MRSILQFVRRLPLFLLSSFCVICLFVFQLLNQHLQHQQQLLRQKKRRSKKRSLNHQVHLSFLFFFSDLLSPRGFRLLPGSTVPAFCFIFVVFFLPPPLFLFVLRCIRDKYSSLFSVLVVLVSLIFVFTLLGHPETIVLHAGYRADPTTTAVAVPIYQTACYQFHNASHAANLFALSEPGNIYTRLMNPTQDVLEKRLAALEGGVAALAVASGQAASTYSILNVTQSGDNFVTSTDLYGGTWNLFANTFKQFGIEARFVDPIDPENFRRASDARTRAYYAETLPNPKLHVFPIAEVAAIGKELGIPLVVDNTAAPIIARPFDHGASIVVYSTTKYIGGHGTTLV